ncbi:unnamed protein product [Cuscuta europaea]|uniref:Uncharacterized protein n=1 Tax=Cuscuta europaea TaxID=41803 RepID=A0A9P1EM36_CUSEU|nr:unnamed protein product [Cuscuta europaea]
MISPTATSSPLLPLKSVLIKPFLSPSFKPLNKYQLCRSRKSLNLRRFGVGKCKAELVNDAPIAVSIGACILNSLVFPVAPSPDEDETDSVIDSADARLAVMGIISFIPYFNWLSWVFAWLDTKKSRYAVYAIVYLAPYLRSNLSLSPEDSWLPVASILLCILHIQLEVSIKNGDIQGLQFFSETRKTDSTAFEEDIAADRKNLPSAQRGDDKRKWSVSEKPSQDPGNLDKDREDPMGRKH